MKLKRKVACEGQPEDFGMSRYIDIGSRLVGWNAVKSRAEQLNLKLTDVQVKDVTKKIKALADVRSQTMEDVDVLLRVYHDAVHAGGLQIGEHDKIDQLLVGARLLSRLTACSCGIRAYAKRICARECITQRAGVVA